MCYRRELITPYCKIISKPACCWSFRICFCLLQEGSGRCRLCLCLFIYLSSYQGTFCFTFKFKYNPLIQKQYKYNIVVVGRFRLFLRRFIGRFLFVLGLFRSLQVVSGRSLHVLQVVEGRFLFVVGRSRLFQVVPRFSKYTQLTDILTLVATF